MYAKQITRMNEFKKMDAEAEGHRFATETGHAFSHIEKEYKSNWVAVMDCDDGDETAADVVECPNCREIQVCWGQFGDPVTEVCICTKCQNSFEMEPF